MRSLRARRAPIGAVITLVAAFAIAGCGSDSGETTTAADSPAASSAAAAPTAIVEDPWVRATKGTKDTSMTAAFMSITNPSDTDVTLVSASTDIAGMVQLHEMAMGADGNMMMQEVPGGFVIPAGGHQHLEPGGNHVMLMGLKQELAPGDEVSFTLTFSDGTTLDITAPVKEFTEEEPHYHESEGADMGEMDMSESPSS
ncbi:MAG: copper chaperone PCu(A)C [Nocardioides sp.]